MMVQLVDILTQYGYWGFFFASFLSATILPFSSELILTGLLVAGASPLYCLILGTLGNTLGGLTCYWMGLFGKEEWLYKYLRVSTEDIDKRKNWIQRFGAFAAFFSFLPVIGDVINVALGYFRVCWWKVAVYMSLGKFTRYLVWMWMNLTLIASVE